MNKAPNETIPEPQDGPITVDRRTVLGLIGGAFGALVVAGCGGSGSSATTAAGTTTSTVTGHAITPEGEIWIYLPITSA